MPVTLHPTKAVILLASLLVSPTAVAQPAAPGDSKQECIDAHATAQELRNAKRLVDAKEKLLVCARESCPALVRQACSDLLASVLQEMPTVAISVSHPNGDAIVDGTITVDGMPWPHLGTARDIDPGVHEIKVSHPIHGDATRTITLLEGKKSVGVNLEIGTPPKPTRDSGPPAPRSYVPPSGAFVFFGLSIAGTGVGATLGGLSLSLGSELDERGESDSCPGESLCDTDENIADRDRLSAYRLGADISFAISGALLASGLIWWIVDATSSPAAPNASISAGLLPLVSATSDGFAAGFQAAF